MAIDDIVRHGNKNQHVTDSSDPGHFTRSVYVSLDGNDTTGTGGPDNPYATVNAALAVVTATRNVIVLMKGSHTITATLSLPNFTMAIVGQVGNPDFAKIDAAVSVTPLIEIAPVLTSTAEYFFQDIAIDNGESAQVGLQIDNALATKKIIVYLDNVWMSDGGVSMNVDHDGASDAVRVYANGNGREIEGNITWDVGNAGDKFFASNFTFGGTFVTSGDNAAALFRFTNCLVPANAWASNDTKTAQLMVVMSCKSVTGTTYAYVDTNDLGAGSDFTETIID